MDSAVELIAYLMTGLQRWHLNNFNIKQTFPKGRKGAKKGNVEAIPRLLYIMSYIISEYQELYLGTRNVRLIQIPPLVAFFFACVAFQRNKKKGERKG